MDFFKEVLIRSLLFWDNTYGYILMAVFVYGFLSRAVMLRVIILWATAIVASLALKSIWQIPLDPELHLVGWAFPSGHTLVAIAFWGTLALESRRTVFIIATTLLLGAIFWATVEKGYHHWADIGAAALIATPAVFFYELVIIRRILGEARVGSLLGLAILWNVPILAYLVHIQWLQIWPWMAEGWLLGASLGYASSHRNENGNGLESTRMRAARAILTIFLLILIYSLYPSKSVLIAMVRGALLGFVFTDGSQRLYSCLTSLCRLKPRSVR